MSKSNQESGLEKPENKPFFEAFIESSQAAMSLASDSELIKTIPFLGSALKVLQGVTDLRSRILAKKLYLFMTDPALQTPEAREAIRGKINESPKAAEQVGETLFLVLDKVVELKKPLLLSKVFLAYSEGVIDLVQLRRLSGAIDVAFVDDIERLRDGKVSQDTLEQLHASGLSVSEHTALFGGFDSFEYRISALGRVLVKILSAPASPAS